MKRAVIAITLAMAGVALGSTFELPLNCTGSYDINTPLWVMDFNLGVTFSAISNVYIDWSGEINASLLQYIGDPNPTPSNGSLIAYIGPYPPPMAGVWGGGIYLSRTSAVRYAKRILGR